MWWAYLVIGLGGALGSVSRSVLATWVAQHFSSSFPWGTFLVNVSGCFVIGLIASIYSPDNRYYPLVRPFLMIGFLGGYTTFSSFSLETLNLMLGREWRIAFAYAFASLFVCLISVIAGYRLGQSF